MYMCLCAHACVLQAGSELEITVNTTRTMLPELQRMNVQLAYLRSYRGLGMALAK